RPRRSRRRRPATASAAPGAASPSGRPWPGRCRGRRRADRPAANACGTGRRASVASAPMAEMEITLPDGSTRHVEQGTTALGLAREISPRLAKAAVIAEINGEERDLGTELRDGDRVTIVTADSERGLYTIRHSTAHVLAQAVLDLFPSATFGIGPPVEDGFYYDFDLPGGATFTPEDLERIEARMREIIDERQPFVRDEVPADDARWIF